MTFKEEPFESLVGKEENAGKEQHVGNQENVTSILIPQCFSRLAQQSNVMELKMLVTSILFLTLRIFWKYSDIME